MLIMMPTKHTADNKRKKQHYQAAGLSVCLSVCLANWKMKPSENRDNISKNDTQ